MTQPAIVFGGPSPEHDVSILTALQCARALSNASVAVTAIYWTKTGEWVEVDPGLEGADFAEGPPRKARPLRFEAGPDGGFFAKRKRLDVGVIVNCCHGGPGEDGTLQAAFDLAGLRYTGPSVPDAALAMDKLAFGAVMAQAGVPTIPRQGLDAADPEPPDFMAPYIVKPRFGGSSIGIEVVGDYDTARALAGSSQHLAAGAVIEPYLAASRDVQIAVRTHPGLELSAIEAPLREAGKPEIYSYADKYLGGGEGMVSAARELPADLEPAAEQRLRELAGDVTQVAGLRSLARIDFLQDGARLVVNEVNTIPGSMASYLWIDPPIPLHRLLGDMIDEAAAAPARRFSAAGADGRVLRSAASIAQKLGG